MHLRIYLWLSCVALAGYVRATENSVIPTQDQTPEYIDDDGSGLEADESSGSGWGAGPGVDDEDGRGSGDTPPGVSDDEDYFVETTKENPTTESVTPEVPNHVTIVDEFAKFKTMLEDTTMHPKDVQIDVVIPRVGKQPIEGSVDVVIGGARDTPPSRPDQTDISISGEETNPDTDHEPAGSNIESEARPADTDVFIMNAKPEDRATSFFAQPGILAAVIGGAVVGLLCAILVVMFIVYRMRKKDEGSYALDEPKRSPAAASYGKGHNNREFYA
ncbi:syndecan [Aphomia sociella]